MRRFRPWIVACRLAAGAAVVLVAVGARAGSAQVDEASKLAARLSDQAFSLLSSVSTASSPKPSPLLGAVANFAGDAQSLSNQLKSSNRAGARRTMAALLADRDSIEAGLKSNPGALKAQPWTALKEELASLEKQVPPLKSKTASARSYSSPLPATSARPRNIPVVKIESYTVEGGAVRVKGFIEGRDLESAGIYQDGRLLKSLKIERVKGSQRVDLDLTFNGGLSEGMELRVEDGAGHNAVAELSSRIAPVGPGEKIVTLGGNPEETEPAVPTAPGSEGHNTAEIPTYGATRPSYRHAPATSHGALAKVRIDILSVRAVDPIGRRYQVNGQILGSGIHHAGIYVDGNLAKRIPLEGGGVSNFDVLFEMGGAQATVRAYGIGDEYVENSIELGEAPAVPPPAVVGYPAYDPGRPVIQVYGVQQVAPQVYEVTGAISGRALASAGLYQNGMMVQSIPVNGGVSGLLGSLLGGSGGSVNFRVRFNPALGPCALEAFDQSGASAVQPVTAGVGYGVNPYTVNRPYANPYGLPYGGAAPSNPFNRGAPPGAKNPFLW